MTSLPMPSPAITAMRCWVMEETFKMNKKTGQTHRPHQWTQSTKSQSLAQRRCKFFHVRDERTTQLTPSAVRAVPANVVAVMASPNSTQAIMAVVGGTKYIKLVTDAAAPR